MSRQSYPFLTDVENALVAALAIFDNTEDGSTYSRGNGWHGQYGHLIDPPRDLVYLSDRAHSMGDLLPPDTPGLPVTHEELRASLGTIKRLEDKLNHAMQRHGVKWDDHWGDPRTKPLDDELTQERSRFVTGLKKVNDGR